jgi:penicillin-binding protein 2
MTEEPKQPRQPIIALRVLLVTFFVLASFGALGAKLYLEQVVNAEKWVARVRRSSSVTVRVPSVRGDIRDRNGVKLVSNRTSYGVDFYLPQIVRGYRETHGNRVPRKAYRANIDEMPKDVQVADVVQILDTTIMPRLAELDISREYDPAVLDRHYRINSEVPYQYLDQVNYETVARLAENDANLPGVDVVLRPVRQYNYGALAAHVLGYVAPIEEINKEPDIKDFDYYQPDLVGRASVEKYCDKYLRGKPGMRVLERTPKGKVGAEISRIPPVPGHHVYLTLDARIQMIVENTLHEAGVGRAAAVVVNPNNGDVLAMANVPNYNPNIFIPKISKAEMKAFDDDETDPLLNRCIQGYLPGSTYKAVTALAGLRAGIDPGKKFNCAGFMTYGRPMKCWIAEKGGAHGMLDMTGGLKNSCNCYFFQLGNMAGLDQIEAIGEALGLGKYTGLPLSGDSPGILPGPKYLAARGLQSEITSKGQIANTSIGQGKVLASPLQMAMVCSAVANNGISYFPRLISRVVDDNGDDLRDADRNLVIPVEPHIRADLHNLGLTTEQISVVRTGMWKVVNEAGGTGAKARIKGVEVAGKTGTAQFWRKIGNEKVKDNRVWFMCFAPFKQPKYVVVVMVEGAKSGGGVAAPLANKILRESLALEVGIEPKVAWQEPVAGKFEHIEEIPLTEDGTLTKVVAQAFQGTDRRPSDDEISVQSDDGPVEARPRIVDQPAVRTEGDRRNAASAQKKPNFFQRLFGPRQPKSPTQPGGPGRGR